MVRLPRSGFPVDRAFTLGDLHERSLGTGSAPWEKALKSLWLKDFAELLSRWLCSLFVKGFSQKIPCYGTSADLC
jgi:hypothetical protein